MSHHIISPEDFLTNVNDQTGFKSLLVGVEVEGMVITPPKHLLQEDSSLYTTYNYSGVNMEFHGNLEHLVFFNHYVTALPENIGKLNKLEALEFQYATTVEVNIELSKLKEISSLKELNIGFSLLDDTVLELFAEELPGLKVTY